MEYISQIMKSLLGYEDITAAKGISWVLVLLVAIILVCPQLQGKGPNLSHIPILRKELGGIDALRAEYAKKGLEMLEEGYHKVCGMSWFYHSARPHL